MMAILVPVTGVAVGALAEFNRHPKNYLDVKRTLAISEESQSTIRKSIR